MTRDELNNAYFEWMYQIVCGNRISVKSSYRKLLYFLHDTEFTYTIPMDGNRAEDGMDLRYRFGYENNYSGPMIATYLDDRPCSVLEMLVALAIRCEEHITDDPDAGDRTGKWFWGMIENLDLNSMDDVKFDREYAERIIHKFLNRKYGRNGEGGLFTLQHCQKDLRMVDIWYQMCWYLGEIYREDL